MFLAEKEVTVETVQVDLMKGEQHKDEFKRLNPWCTVPVLELDDGTTISEITACCLYIEEMYPDRPLMGSDPKEKAFIAMWNLHMENDGYQAAADAFRNTAKGFENRATTGPNSHPQIPELALRGKARLVSFFELLDNQLSDNLFICGDKLSIADITAFVTVDFAKWIKVTPLESQSNLARWYGTISERKSSKA